MRWRAAWFAGLVFIATLPGVAHGRSLAELSPDQAVFLLEYIGSDYELAVRDGEIRDAFEYAEVLNFSRLLQKDYRRARPDGDGPVPELLQTLTRKIVAKDPSPSVRETVTALVPLLGQSLGASPAPRGPVDLARGRRVYVAHCESCHGSQGAGDGPAAVGMKPPATSFVEQRAQLLSIRQIAGAVRFGIEGTPMAAFEGALDRGDIHAVSFYVASLTQKANLPRASSGGLEGGAPESEPISSGSTIPARALELSFVGVSDRVSPAVVGISALVADPDAKQPPAGGVTRHGGWQRSQEVASRHPGFAATGIGSGFFIRPDGTLLTARHFLLNPDTGGLADRIEVELPDDQRYLAWVVGLEPMIDLAVLRVDAPAEVPVVSLDRGREASVGQWIIALGNPPGIERAFVVGTLSATPRRECYQEEPSETLFQTSAWVEAGIFGGPVVDIDGRLLGMAQPRPGHNPPPHVPSALRILPIELAQTIYESLRVEAEKVSPWLGFSVVDLSRDLRRRLPDAPRTGVYIDDVFVPSPASEAGIQAEDVLVAVEGRDLLSVADFQRELYLAGVGREVSLSILRGESAMTKRVRIEQRPGDLLP